LSALMRKSSLDPGFSGTEAVTRAPRVRWKISRIRKSSSLVSCAEAPFAGLTYETIGDQGVEVRPTRPPRGAAAP